MVAVVADEDPVDESVEAVAPQEPVSVEASTETVSVPIVAELVAEVELVAAVVLVAVEADDVWTASAPVMARNEPALMAAAAVRARLAGWGRRRRPVGVGAGEVGEGVASMDPTVRSNPGNPRRASGDAAGTLRGGMGASGGQNLGWQTVNPTESAPARSLK